MWKLHHRAIYHGDRLAKFVPQLRACPRCAADSESLEHAFYSCPAVRPFWERVQATMVDNQNTQITAVKVLALEFRPRAGIKPDTYILPLVCALWSVYRARTRAVFEPAQTSVPGMTAWWKHQVGEILLAKHRPASSWAPKASSAASGAGWRR